MIHMLQWCGHFDPFISVLHRTSVQIIFQEIVVSTSNFDNHRLGLFFLFLMVVIRRAATARRIAIIVAVIRTLVTVIGCFVGGFWKCMWSQPNNNAQSSVVPLSDRPVEELPPEIADIQKLARRRASS